MCALILTLTLALGCAGPIFQSPDSLVRAFGAQRTDLFKAAALRGTRVCVCV